MFDVTNKVALVTGGASGIGFHIVQELLRNNLKACTIADINENQGHNAVNKINEEFGPDRVIFVKTNVTNYAEFEAAFSATVAKFQHVDIVVNNAGILGDDLERTIPTNINGAINGILLGMENFLQKHRTGTEGVILNVASIASIDPISSFPIYTCTKYAVLGLTRSFGAKEHYNRTNVKVIAICPGLTNTYSLTDLISLGPVYSALGQTDLEKLCVQPPDCVGKAAVRVIEHGEPGSVWIIENSEPPYEINFPTKQEMRKRLIS